MAARAGNILVWNLERRERMNLSDYNTGKDDPQTILAIGDSGTGKSIAMASWKRANDDRKIYFASCDGRMSSVAEWYRGQSDYIDFDIFTSFEPLNEKIDSFESYCPYQTVIVDPITNLSDFLMKYSFSLRGLTIYDEQTGKAVKGSKGNKKGIIDLTSIEDFNVEHRGIADMISNLKIAQQVHKFNMIFTAHLITTQYTSIGGKDSHIRRDILTAGKKIAAFLPSQFDEIFHFYVEDGEYKAKTFNDGIVAARSSFSLMPREITWTKKNFYEQVSKYFIQS